MKAPAPQTINPLSDINEARSAIAFSKARLPYTAMSMQEVDVPRRWSIRCLKSGAICPPYTGAATINISSGAKVALPVCVNVASC